MTKRATSAGTRQTRRIDHLAQASPECYCVSMKKPKKAPAKGKAIRLQDVPLVRLEGRVAELEKFCADQQRLRTAVALAEYARRETRQARADADKATQAVWDLITSLVKNPRQSWAHHSGATIKWEVIDGPIATTGTAGS